MIISTTVTLLLIGTLFSFGYLLQALKKFISLFFKVILNILSFFGIKFFEKEKQIKLTPEFKSVYKDIKVMKLSNKNLKEKSSIDWFAFILLIVAGLLVVLNMKGVFVADHNVISDWNERNLRTPEQVLTFLEQRKQFNKDKAELTKKAKKETFEQREYDNLSFLYANNNEEGEKNG